ELPRVGARFDEFDYEKGKASLAELLAEASYAGAQVSGKVELDHRLKTARITYQVVPGPSHRFGEVHVEGQGELPVAPIIAAARIAVGQPYRQSMLTEVQQEVYALGAFSAVEVERILVESERLVDLRVKVSLLPRNVWRVGFGIMSGAFQRTETGELASVP